jgi:uncharacterized protein (TIGR03083 family)
VPDATDLVYHYDAAHRSFFDCLRALHGEQLELTVPATPAWTVRDLVAHVVGVTCDVAIGHGPSGAMDEWTAHQVATRQGSSVEALIAEFDESAPTVRRLLKSGRVTDPRITANAFIHELDIRATAPAPGIPDRDTFRFTLDLGLEGLRGRVTKVGLPGLEIAHGDELWAYGASPEIRLKVPRYDLHRALFGRRSVDQMRAFNWNGNPEP